MDARLEKAKELVFEGKLTVPEIAMRTGYANTNHFIKAFKNSYAETPKRARLGHMYSLLD